MLFNSFEFIVFFILVTTSYFILPHKFRWLLLLVASCYFYMAFVPIYILILFGTILIDYFAGILIENAEGKKRKSFLILSLFANIGVLAVFKYYNFFATNINELLSSFSLKNIPLLRILLPIGLSFHTFQAMSYTIEVYRGNQKAERHFGIYSLYVMFYPQLVAGPIERPQNILHQFYEKHSFNWTNFEEGAKKILWGFFKKVVIADRLALVVGNVYNHPQGHNGLEIILATIFFSFQIYCDFSGYSDIALGAAEMMGFKLMTNFNKPYFASSISEFWKRWHISLSTWFRDYLYISLGGNRVSKWRIYLNMFIVFLVSGLWHGANWTFIVWGALHGTYLMIEQLISRKSKSEISNSKRNIKIGINFILVAFAWIFFRATSMKDAMYIVSHIGNGWRFTSFKFYQDIVAKLGSGDLLYGTFNITISLLLIFILLFIEKISKHRNPIDLADRVPVLLKWTIYYIIILSICILGVYDNKEFIYFQF